MPSSRLRSRLGSAAVLSALALSLIAVPASAAGKVRVVDNDGKGSATNCDATTKAFAKIQKAIDASAAGDLVKVCPGTYKERLSITGARAGLQVLSTKAGGAIVRDPDIYLPVMPPLVAITDVANVTFKGFKVRTLTWESYLSSQMEGIVADGATNVSILGNDVSWAGGSGELSQLITAITAKGGTTGLIKGNTIKDARQDGVLVTGSGTNVDVAGNTISFPFVGHPDVDALYGVEVTGAATARVKGNQISVPAVASGIVSNAAAGVQLNNAGSATVVRNNRITNPVSGIRTYGNGYDLLDNEVVGRQIGINIVNSDGLTVTGNTAKGLAGSGYGISATEASDNSVISGNDVRGSTGPDCYEQDTDTDGIDNTWSQNVFNDASPSGLCTDGDVPG